MENAFKMEFFNSAKFFNNAKNQLEFTKETRFARYLSKFSLIFGIKKILLRLKIFPFFKPRPYNKYSLLVKLQTDQYVRFPHPTLPLSKLSLGTPYLEPMKINIFFKLPLFSQVVQRYLW